jgi:hypothetical protein
MRVGSSDEKELLNPRTLGRKNEESSDRDCRKFDGGSEVPMNIWSPKDTLSE